MSITAKKLSEKPVLTPMLRMIPNPVNNEDMDLFDHFGWEDLPFILKKQILADLTCFRDELLGLYSTRNQGVFERRKSVAFWVNNYLSGNCSLETAYEMLEVNS